ncbi:MAG: hypothetical protein LZF60_300018 [Nitrospira sp.]|nr:MAG: hypothetical protein LZF60_300018 [Nitrospira sp.]
MLPLPSPANVGVTQPPQITAGGVSTSRNRWPAPAASPALCSSAPAGAVMAMAISTLAQSAMCLSLPLFILKALLVRNDVTAPDRMGLQAKKTPFRSNRWTKRTSLSSAYVLSARIQDVVVLRSPHTGEVYTPPCLILSSSLPQPFCPLMSVSCDTLRAVQATV